MYVTLGPSRACLVVGRAPYHALGTSGVVFARRVQLQKRAKKRQMKRHPSRRCALPNTGFLNEVKPLWGQGPPKDHMLWGERHSTLKRGACYACVKMGFYGRRGVFRCFFRARLCEAPKLGMRDIHDPCNLFWVCTSTKFQFDRHHGPLKGR